MRALTGNKGVHTFTGRQFQISASPAGDNADAAANILAARNNRRRGASCPGKPFRKFSAGNVRVSLQSNGLPVADKKRFQLFQAERGGQLRVVSQFGMRIQRQMGAVNGKVVFDQQAD